MSRKMMARPSKGLKEETKGVEHLKPEKYKNKIIRFKKGVRAMVKGKIGIYVEWSVTNISTGFDVNKEQALMSAKKAIDAYIRVGGT